MFPDFHIIKLLELFLGERAENCTTSRGDNIRRAGADFYNWVIQ